MWRVILQSSIYWVENNHIDRVRRNVLSLSNNYYLLIFPIDFFIKRSHWHMPIILKWYFIYDSNRFMVKISLLSFMWKRIIFTIYLQVTFRECFWNKSRTNALSKQNQRTLTVFWLSYLIPKNWSNVKCKSKPNICQMKLGLSQKLFLVFSN